MRCTWVIHKVGVWLVAWVFGLVPAGARAGTVSYSYDEAGRLLQADYAGATIDYVYDANGNLLERTVTEDEVIYTLIYRAGTGGTVDGLPVVTQQVARGESGTAVTAVVEDAGAVFGRWSDGHTDATRTDTNVQADIDVLAGFRSTGGADLDWYALRGIAPKGGETSWTDVDARPVPGKGTTYRQENIADTDPENPNDIFRILALTNTQPVTVVFVPGSTARFYTLQMRTNLLAGAWTNVPGQGPRIGAGGVDAMQDDNTTPPQYYRIRVELP